MAEFDSSKTQHPWAKIPSPVIFWKSLERLLRAETSKSSLLQHLLQNQVKTRFPPFLKLCYALDRPPCHGHFELWSTKNGGVFWKKCWMEIWWFKLVLYDACYVARFHANGCWIHDVCCLPFPLICWFAISGKVFHDDDEQDDECVAVKTLPSYLRIHVRPS